MSKKSEQTEDNFNSFMHGFKHGAAGNNLAVKDQWTHLKIANYELYEEGFDKGRAQRSSTLTAASKRFGVQVNPIRMSA